MTTPPAHSASRGRSPVRHQVPSPFPRRGNCRFGKHLRVFRVIGNTPTMPATDLTCQVASPRYSPRAVSIRPPRGSVRFMGRRNGSRFLGSMTARPGARWAVCPGAYRAQPRRCRTALGDADRSGGLGSAKANAVAFEAAGPLAAHGGVGTGLPVAHRNLDQGVHAGAGGRSCRQAGTRRTTATPAPGPPGRVLRARVVPVRTGVVRGGDAHADQRDTGESGIGPGQPLVVVPGARPAR